MPARLARSLSATGGHLACSSIVSFDAPSPVYQRHRADRHRPPVASPRWIDSRTRSLTRVRSAGSRAMLAFPSPSASDWATKKVCQRDRLFMLVTNGRFGTEGRSARLAAEASCLAPVKACRHWRQGPSLISLGLLECDSTRVSPDLTDDLLAALTRPRNSASSVAALSASVSQFSQQK